MIFKSIMFKKEKNFTFLEKGEGHPMVLLHGLMGGLSNFEEMADFFADKGFKVYVPQLPVYDLPVLNTNLTSLAKFVGKFIKHQIGKPVTLVGNSMGGTHRTYTYSGSSRICTFSCSYGKFRALRAFFRR